MKEGECRRCPEGEDPKICKIATCCQACDYYYGLKDNKKMAQRNDFELEVEKQVTALLKETVHPECSESELVTFDLPSSLRDLRCYCKDLQRKCDLLTLGLLREKNYITNLKNQLSKSLMATNQFFYPKPICENRPPDTFSGWNACLSCAMSETCRLLYGKPKT